MTIYGRKNFSGDLSGFVALNPQSGDIFEFCNFSQLLPRTEISDSYTGLTFRYCNMMNILLPADATIIDCNTAQIDKCSHLHPDAGLDEEVANCRHVVDTDEVYYDGELIKTFYHREDQLYSYSSSSSSSSTGV